MDYLYKLFILPLEFIISFLLIQIYKYTGNYGFSIVALSATVSISIIPLYNIAEKWRNKERKLFEKIKPKIDEFKSVFSGSEFHAYIQVLYKQNNYHPLLALRSSLGILIQIPFFIAAYHLLSNYKELNGVPFMFISDLSRPDRIILIEGHYINLLPFIMTILSLISTYIYTKNSTYGEKVQLYGLSVFFLIVLYKSPSGLLLYWTFNNLFSLLKNLLSASSIKQNAVILITRLFKEKRNTFYLKKLNNSRLNSNLFFKTIYLYLKKFKLFNDLIISKTEVNVLFYLSLIVSGLLIFILSPIALLGVSSGSDFTGSLINYIMPLISWMISYFVIFIILFLFSTDFLKMILSLSLTLISSYGLINIFIFPTDYGEMSNFVFQTRFKIPLAVNIINFSIFFLLFLVIIFSIKYRKIRWINSFFTISFISIFIFIISSIFDYYSEERNNPQFSNDFKKIFSFSKKNKNVVIIMLDRFIGCNVAESFEMISGLKNKYDGFVWYPKSLSCSTQTMGGLPSILGGYDYTISQIHNTRQNKPLLDKINESILVLPYNFEKAGFKTSLFSPSTYCFQKIDIGNLKNCDISDINGKYNNLWLKEHGVTIDNDNYSLKLVQFGAFRFSPPILRGWLYNNGKWRLKEKNTVFVNNLSPVYEHNSENYISFNVIQDRMKKVIDNWSTLEFLPKISKIDIDNDFNGKFYFIQNNLTHEPWNINSDFNIQLSGRLFYSKEIYERLLKKASNIQHLYADAAALKLLTVWFDWMKKNDVYNNTRIIIVSDHGWHNVTYDPLFNKTKIPGTKKTSSNTIAFHNLLLVKDFNSTGKANISEKFMTTADVPALALNGIIEGHNPYTGNNIFEPQNKIPFDVVHIDFRPHKQGKFKYSVIDHYRVTDENIFDIKNWEVVYEK